ncbi:MAG: 16S rRNA (adenine(1518)-N(6)/adenine(1519)-N(6))-dimethyltransferase RsmA [Polyangia bacterium]
MSAPTASALLKKYNLRAKKSWGQNFLVDERAYRAIVDAMWLDKDKWAIEVGAGLGTLTYRLGEVAGRVIAVERDRDMCALLRAELGSHENIELHEANALTFDYAEVARRHGAKVGLVGNLPYQIASQILFRLLETPEVFSRIVVMLQKEMADRIVSPPGQGAYGALSVMLQQAGQVRIVCRVRAGGFLPAPRVDSAVVELVPYANGRAPVKDAKRFSQVVHATFQMRRKTLRNSLAPCDTPEAIAAALASTGIDGQRRGETLSVEEFAALSDALTHA